MYEILTYSHIETYYSKPLCLYYLNSFKHRIKYIYSLRTLSFILHDAKYRILKKTITSLTKNHEHGNYRSWVCIKMYTFATPLRLPVCARNANYYNFSLVDGFTIMIQSYNKK